MLRKLAPLSALALVAAAQAQVHIELDEPITAITPRGARVHRVHEPFDLGGPPSHEFGRVVSRGPSWVAMSDPNAASARGRVTIHSHSCAVDCPVELQAIDGVAGDRFGAALDVTDTVQIAVGAPYRQRVGLQGGITTVRIRCGAVYVFDYRTQVQRIELPFSECTGWDFFGHAIANEGNVLAVGAPGNQGAGRVYVYRYVSGAWQREATLAPPYPVEQFGYSVAVDIDTGVDRIVVGAPSDFRNGASGTAFVFRADTPGAWTHEFELHTPLQSNSGPDGPATGFAVAIDRGRAFVGAPLDGAISLGSGVVHEYELRLDLFTGTRWDHVRRVWPEQPSFHRHFGASLALEDDLLAVGAPADSSMSQLYRTYAGHVFLVRDGELLAKMNRSAGDLEQRFGASVAMSGGRLVVGHPDHQKSPHQDDGGAFTFLLSDLLPPKPGAPHDYDGDGISDLAFHNPGSAWSTMPMLRGVGDGAWLPTNQTAPFWVNQPGVISIPGDFDGDGIDDVSFHRPGSPWVTVPVLFGTPIGTWNITNALVPEFANQPGTVAIPGDFDGDGRSDIAFHQPGSLATIVHVLFANGDGSWVALNIATPNWANQEDVVALPGDYDGDGTTDIAFHRPDGPWASVPVLFGSPSRSLSSTNSPTPAWPHGPGVRAVCGDFNGDRKDDIVFHEPGSHRTTIPMLISRGDGSWEARESAFVFGTIPDFVYAPGVVWLAGDFDGDGNDQIAFHRPGSSISSIPIANVGSGLSLAFGVDAPAAVNDSGTIAIVGDYDADGQDDLAFHRPGGLGTNVPVLRYRPGGAWFATAPTTPNWPNQAGVFATTGGCSAREVMTLPGSSSSGLEMTMTPPVAGSTLIARATGFYPLTIARMILSLGAPTPVDMGGSRIYLGSSTTLVLPTVTQGNGIAELSVPIPGGTEWVGVGITVQALSIAHGTSAGFEVTDGSYAMIR